MTLGYCIYIIILSGVYFVSIVRGMDFVNDIYCIIGLLLISFSKVIRINILMEQRRIYNKRNEDIQKYRAMRITYKLSIPMLIIAIIGFVMI